MFIQVRLNGKKFKRSKANNLIKILKWTVYISIKYIYFYIFVYNNLSKI